MKNLEKIRPSAILDLVRSGEDMARLVPASVTGISGRGASTEKTKQQPASTDEEEGDGGCGSANGRSSGGEMAEMERKLRENEEAESRELDVSTVKVTVERPNREAEVESSSTNVASIKHPEIRTRQRRDKPQTTPKKLPSQQMGKCERCGYMSSQKICKACTLLEGLNKNRPSRDIGLDEPANTRGMETRIAELAIASGEG